jgi:hypothetical protein
MSGEHELDRGSRRIYLAIAWVSLLTIVAVTVYGLFEWVTGHVDIVGQQLVNVYWPINRLFAQPVTYFSVACVALFYSGLRLLDHRIRRWPKWVLSTLQLVGFVVAFSSAYEVLYNFMLWGATYSIACASNLTACNPDAIITNYPVPWNLVFATRAFSALFVISGYSVYYLRRIVGGNII